MPRALLVRPGPNFSVADVADGWKQGLLANGYDVLEYDLDSRLQHFAGAYRRDAGDGYVPAVLEDEQVVWLATEPVKGFCYDWWPDVVVCISGFYWTEHLSRIIRQRGHKLLTVFTESPYQEDTQLARASWGVDLAVLNDPTHLDRYRAAGVHAMYLPHSYRPDVHCPAPVPDRYTSDVCFVGTGYPSRLRWFESVNWQGIDLRLLGNWASMPEGHALADRVHVYDTDPERGLEQCIGNTETVNWYRGAKASVNLYRKEADRPELADGYAMGPREVELAATGCFYVTERRAENSDRLPMVPKFDTPGEAEDLLRWYLARPDRRTTVATKARAAIADWTFTNRVAEALHELDRTPRTFAV